MRKIAKTLCLTSLALLCNCRTTGVSGQKGVFDKKLATCRVIELNKSMFEALKDTIALESVADQSAPPTQVQKVEVIDQLRGPMTMQIGDTILSNAAPLRLDDPSKTAFSVDSLNRPIGYVLIIDANKSGTLGAFERAQLRFGHRPQDIAKSFAKVLCD
jgi:hypothetical protein